MMIVIADTPARGHRGGVADLPPRRIAIVAYEGAHALDAVGPLEVFSAADELLRFGGRRGYEVGVTTPTGGAVRCESGLDLGGRWRLGDLGRSEPLPHTVLVAGGRGSRRVCDDAEVVDEVRRLALAADRAGSVCTGAFVLAATGLLDGRRATTHWAWAPQLAEAHPSIEVEPDSIYTRDGDVWTSAGVTAGMDLALALVADDHDDETARQVAQWLVMYLRRSGGQSQFSPPVTASEARRDEIRRVQDWIAANPAGDCAVGTLAEMAAMSPRHFARVFREQVGVTPARYVEACRLDLARSLLETTDLTVVEVARRSGLGDASTLHRAFDRHLSVSPAAYRVHHSSHRRNVN